MMMRRTAAGITAAVAFAACSAATPIPAGRALEPSSTYVSALDKATRRVEHLETLDLHTYVYATLVTPDFTRAFDTEYHAVYGPAAAAPALSAADDATVFLSLATNDRATSDLAAFGRLWVVTYANGSTAVTPRHIERYDRDALFMRYFFPYWSPWQQIYRVSFALPASTTTGGALELNGVGGHIKLAW